MVGFAVIVAIAIALGGLKGVSLPVLASAFIVGFSISASAMILNDIADIEIDRVNAPQRPLPSGRISIREAFYCYAMCTLVGILASTYTGFDSLIVASLGAAASVLYDLRLKLSGFPGNVLVAFSTSLPFLYAYTVVEAPTRRILFFWVMVFLAVLAREIIKDIADVEGDRRKGARTIPIVYGERKASLIAFIIILFDVVISVIPLIENIVNRIIYIVLIGITDILLLYSSLLLIINLNKNTALLSKKIILIVMLIGLIGFMLSSINT